MPERLGKMNGGLTAAGKFILREVQELPDTRRKVMKVPLILRSWHCCLDMHDGSLITVLHIRENEITTAMPSSDSSKGMS